MNRNPEESVIHLCLDRLSDLYGQQIALQKKVQLGGGCINHAMRLECNVGSFFLKWNSSCAEDMFLKEAAGLEEMYDVENIYLKIPKVIWAKKVDELPGFLLMEYLQPTGITSGYDEKLGRGLAIMHQKKASAYGFKHNNYCGLTPQDNRWNVSWIDFFGRQRIKHLLELIKRSRGLTSEDENKYYKLIEHLPEILSHKTVPSLIHGDLWSGNYMYTLNGPALIDPAVYYADREMELSIVTMFGGFSRRFWDAYREMYPMLDGWQERNTLYQLYHVLNHYYLFGGGYISQANQIVRHFI